MINQIKILKESSKDSLKCCSTIHRPIKIQTTKYQVLANRMLIGLKEIT